MHIAHLVIPRSVGWESSVHLVPVLLPGSSFPTKDFGDDEFQNFAGLAADHEFITTPSTR